MASIYDSADIYDLLDNDDRDAVYQKHWEYILQNRHIESLLDISIGSGSVTLPLAALGVRLTGSDLSETMLDNCRKKAQARQLGVTLQCCDFRTIASHFTQKFDCVASTGNSLPYVSNSDVLKTLEQMDSLIQPGGYLYFDIRNWDKILRERNRFYLYNPFFDGDTRINLIQVWDYHDDNSMTFNLLYTFEKDNRIFRKEKFEEHYIPVSRMTLLDKIQSMGYEEISVMPFPSGYSGASTDTSVSIDDIDWYCVIAKKC
ncbi:MAG: class I SAM-dependent methyltransferase [Clostridium sp.]|nr:class I SAM-dependent methyltransferase [Clostridium sp.]